MSKTTEQLEQEGFDAFLAGKRYTQLNGSVAAIYRGWDKACRLTKNGFRLKEWNKQGNYKTSADISTLF